MPEGPLMESPAWYELADELLLEKKISQLGLTFCKHKGISK